MKFKYGPVLVFAAMTAFQTQANAGIFDGLFRGLGNLSCEAWGPGIVDQAVANHDRMSTPLPRGAFRQVVPFRESDFQTKPWMREYEIVVVVNNSSPYLHHEQFPAQHPIPYSLADFGLTREPRDGDTYQAQQFMQMYGNEAKKVRNFGELLLDVNKKPIPSNKPGAQTIRVYQYGRLVLIDKISTGRGTFELRDKIASCTKRPDNSYFSITEPGYYNFQELIRSGYKSGEWDMADMPNAMFYKRGRGLALHEVSIPAKIASLGKRASGGCTRLHPYTASTLFNMVERTRGATIPVLDEQGNPVYDSYGRIQYKNQETIIWGEGTRNEARHKAPSYNALLIIQPDAVVDADPYNDQSRTLRYR